ncbi:SDR family oxidoreductase [Haloarcula pellucida]|uniref:3-hydroxybutyrate dehydrogenase n=1 Tax=Haloarcula pellucida TaxID=1427151 RepID=A0A830GMP2_9EURY|nr:SDR family oxidoreductase [Halomicroarcula pellucida]MBX0347890.1 SDR family oxidoreductase [Halomicroarcula pellucida]GGN95918.1 3-hydroxybutyrate dehydrogenase [Halomicroarcula pellucida]
MTDSEFDLSAPELTHEDFLVLEDPYFEADTVAIVTGAASGIGRATAVALAANGLTVVGADIDRAGLDETGDIAEDCGVDGTFHGVETDLTNDDDVEAVVAAAAEEGDVRFVANIAGMQHIASIPEFPMETYDRLTNVMLRSPFKMAQAAMPHVRDTDDGVGAIANMSSVHGHYATKDKAAYVTAKHGLTGLTRAIAAEGDGTLRGFSVSVGYVLTPLMVDQIEDTATERGISEQEVIEDVMLGQARTKEMMAPAEVANLFVFGFSSHAKHLNGGDLLFDGGYTHTYE